MAKITVTDIDELFKQTLIVGPGEEQIADWQELNNHPFQSCSGLIEATNLAAQGKCRVVCFIAAEVEPNLRQAIKALKSAHPDIVITLVVPMYQEPFVLEMLNCPDQSRSIDDYIVSPADSGEIISMLKKLANLGKEQQAHSEALDHLAKLATEDDLTGLKNRRYVREFLRQILEQAAESSIRVTLLMFDIDNFKHYNDVYGHGAGDEILKEAASLMRRCCRRHDVVGRIGGDEFAVVFWDNPTEIAADQRRKAQAEHPHEIYFIADRFRRELASTEFPELGPEGKGVLTISGGIAGFPEDGASVEELFASADRGLLEAKRLGKNRIYLIGEPEGI